MNIYEDTNPKELKDLLKEIRNGATVLPDFQRDFVWDPNMTQELIVSIANNYPAGSLLRLRNTKNLFKFREFQGAPKIQGGVPTFLILDGQQRLTSLFQAFYGVGDFLYFIDIQSLLDGKDFEDSFFFYRHDHRRAKEFGDEENQQKNSSCLSLYSMMATADFSIGFKK